MVDATQVDAEEVLEELEDTLENQAEVQKDQRPPPAQPTLPCSNITLPRVIPGLPFYELPPQIL